MEMHKTRKGVQGKAMQNKIANAAESEKSSHAQKLIPGCGCFDSLPSEKWEPRKRIQGDEEKASGVSRMFPRPALEG